MKKIFLLICLFYSLPAMALTCINDYSGTNGCVSIETAADDCTNLGYSNEEDDPDCKHYIHCPFDTNYKVCVDKTASDSGDTEAKTCAGLGYYEINATNIPIGYECEEVMINNDTQSCYACNEGDCSDYNTDDTKYFNEIPTGYNECGTVIMGEGNWIKCYYNCKPETDENGCYENQIYINGQCQDLYTGENCVFKSKEACLKNAIYYTGCYEYEVWLEDYQKTIWCWRPTACRFVQDNVITECEAGPDDQFCPTFDCSDQVDSGHCPYYSIDECYNYCNKNHQQCEDDKTLSCFTVDECKQNCTKECYEYRCEDDDLLSFEPEGMDCSYSPQEYDGKTYDCYYCEITEGVCINIWGDIEVSDLVTCKEGCAKQFGIFYEEYTTWNDNVDYRNCYDQYCSGCDGYTSLTQ